MKNVKPYQIIALFVFIFIFNVISRAETVSDPESKSDLKGWKALPVSLSEAELPIVELKFDFKRTNHLTVNDTILGPENLFLKMQNSELHLNYPTTLIAPKLVEFLSRNGQVLLSQKTSDSFSGQVVFSAEVISKLNEPFRVCLSSQDELKQQGIILCTGEYVFKDGKIQDIAQRTSRKLLVQNENSNQFVQTLRLSPQQPILFYAHLLYGITYQVQIYSPIPELKYLQWTDSGYVAVPLNEQNKLIPLDLNQKKITTDFGGTLSLNWPIQLDDLKKRTWYIPENFIPSTYEHSKKVIIKNATSEEIEWELEAPLLHEPNLNKKKEVVFELFRYDNQEISLRTSGLLSNGQALVFAEINYQHWFENIIGSNSYYLSNQRWGVQLKAQQSLNKFKAEYDSETQELDMTTTTFDLKYRLQPGAWGRDETVGLILGTHSLNIGEFQMRQYGVGVFWARMMPQVFDQFFNQISFLNYPKWVDMEYVHYVGTFNSSDYKLGNNSALNFHGKIFWKPQFFGELGFGIKNYHFDSNLNDQQFNLETFYGTVGLGINF